MKNFKNLGFQLALFSVSFFVSCEDDGTGGGGTTPPDVINVQVSGPGVEVSANFGDTLVYTVTASEGTSTLNAITVRGDGEILPSDRLIIDGVGALNNPFLLTGDDKVAITTDIGIIASLADTTYQIIVTADDNSTVTSEFIINAIGLPPTLDYATSMSGDIDVPPATSASFPLTGTVGTGQLSSISVTVDGDLIDGNRISFDGPSEGTNPIVLGAEDADGFISKSLTIRSDIELGAKVYVITLTDIYGLQSTINQTIRSVGSAVESEMGVFFNRSGMQNGGFDFENNSNVSSTSAAADIRDLGNVSTTDPTWVQAFEAVNGAEVKKIIAGQGSTPEDFTFEGIEFKEDLGTIFDGGIAYSSETVQVGDIYAVNTGDSGRFVFEIANIIVTNDNNDDGYEINIKK